MAPKVIAGGDRATSGLVGKTISYIVFATWALITVLPLIWMFYSSFKSNDELITNIYALPHDLFVNSVIYTSVSTFLIAFLSLMISFALSKMPFRKLSSLVLALIGMGYLLSIQSVIIPLFLMLSSAKLTDTHFGIIIVYTAFGLPLAVLLLTQFMRGLPDSLIESAYMDGASVFRTFTSIMVPMSTPVIITVSIISALGIWNEFLLVLVLASSESTKSLPVGVYSFTSLMGTQLEWQLAALVIATAPAMAVYLAFNKSITKGVVAGALKG